MLPLFLYSVSSNIAQTFLNSILEALLHSDTQVRNAALMVVVQIMHQGLVHPNQVKGCLRMTPRSSQYWPKIVCCNLY